MFAALRDFFESIGGESQPRFQPDDTRLALAALLVHSVAIDGVTSEAERVKLRELLSRHYGVDGEELELLIRQATAAEREAVDLYRFTSVLKGGLTKEQRIGVVEDLWEIVFADGKSHEFEENLVWRVAELLGVDRRERIAAKHHVAQSNHAENEGDD